MSNNLLQNVFYIYGFIFVRPRRWLFWKMICGSFGLHILPEYDECFECWRLPNIHWWLLYKTVFKFFSWLHYDAWRVFCRWDRIRLTYPLIARIIHRIGETTAGYAISGGECFHCGSIKGCQVDLSSDETGKYFILGKTWTNSSQDGTDYRFCGTTICPVCGYKSYYEDGSL